MAQNSCLCHAKINAIQMDPAYDGSIRYLPGQCDGGKPIFPRVKLAERQQMLLVDDINEPENIMKKEKVTHPFHLRDMVILPDHLLEMWTLPKRDANDVMRFALIKAGFTRRIPKFIKIRSK